MVFVVRRDLNVPIGLKTGWHFLPLDGLLTLGVSSACITNARVFVPSALKAAGPVPDDYGTHPVALAIAKARAATPGTPTKQTSATKISARRPTNTPWPAARA